MTSHASAGAAARIFKRGAKIRSLLRHPSCITPGAINMDSVGSERTGND